MTREESIEVYKAYSKMLFNASLRIVGDSAEAEEIMQDTILKYITSPFRPSSGARTTAWLKRTCIRASIDALRRKKREMLFLDGYAAGECVAEDDGDVVPDMSKIRKAIDELPENYRLIISLILIEGLDYGEVSRYTKVKEGTIRVQYSRARAMLAGKLKGLLR